MRESLLTIPINEILEPKDGCPICRMRDMLESRTIEYIMGAAMMEPDVRIATNKVGFCHTHFSQMQKQKNRLSLALMLQTHIDEARTQILEKKSFFEGKNAKKYRLSEINSSCFVCEKIEWGMERLFKTMFEMYSHDEIKKLWSEQEFICLPHYELMMSLSSQNLPKNEVASFENMMTSLVKNYMDSLYNDISKYCSMYDYRNSGKDADWGNSKDSIERAIKFLVARDGN